MAEYLGIQVKDMTQKSKKARFRFLEHTADAKFQAFGNTLEEAFSNAAIAMVSLMWDPDSIQIQKRHAIKVEGKDLAQLLVHFLEEILYILDSKNFLLGAVKIDGIAKDRKNYTLKASFQGDSYSEEYTTFGEVKAVTYNEMKIESGDQYLVQVVVDI